MKAGELPPRPGEDGPAVLTSPTSAGVRFEVGEHVVELPVVEALALAGRIVAVAECVLRGSDGR